MADGEIIIPEENPILDWHCYHLRVDFYPSIKLTRREGLRFAEHISEYIEIEEVQPGISEWRLAGGASCDGVYLRVAKSSIAFTVHDPSNGLEWYEHRFEPVLRAFGGTFSPQVALRRNALVACLLDFPGDNDVDARAFLGGWVMLLHPYKLAPIERPLHVLGVRLFFPPFEGEERDSGEPRKTDWSVNVRVESSTSDTRRLYLEADAVWGEPKPWSEDVVSDAVGRLSVASEFVKREVISFLRQPPFPENGED